MEGEGRKAKDDYFDAEILMCLKSHFYSGKKCAFFSLMQLEIHFWGPF